MKIARNAPCPCGSGRKHKLCCGTTRDQELAVERVLERLRAVVNDIAGHAVDYPRLRPAGAAFTAWADRVHAQSNGAVVGDGIALLTRRERRRIERAYRKEFPEIWRWLREEVGDDDLAAKIAITGAVLAAVVERREPDSRVLELIEELPDVRRDPCEALAMALDAEDLWSVRESFVTDAALAALPDELDDEEYHRRWEERIAAQATRMGRRWHEERLAMLVDRLRARLPIEKYPAASEALAAACEAFDRDKELRARLSAALLADSITASRMDLPLAA